MKERVKEHFLDIYEIVRVIERESEEGTRRVQIHNAIAYFYKMIVYSKHLLDVSKSDSGYGAIASKYGC